MKIESKLVLSCTTLELLLEPLVHELGPWNFPFLPLFKYNLMQMRFLCKT
jgi:hypothetical protein